MEGTWNDRSMMRDYSRRHFLKVMGAAAGAVGLGGIAAACSTAASSRPRRRRVPRLPPATAAASSGAASPSAAAAATGTFNWMTWGDHSYPAQLDAIASTNSIKANSTLFSDNVDAYTKLKEVGGQLDMVSGDALWVPHYFESGLIEAWDINSLAVPSSSTRSPGRSRSGRSPRAISAIRSAGRPSRSTTTRPRSRRRRIRGRSCSTRSTRSGWSSRTSRSRSWPTWASSPERPMRTA